MADRPTATHQDIRYEPDERPPLALSIGLGFQYAILAVAGIVLTPVMMIRIAGGSEVYLSWAVFAALVISGTTTIIQSVRVGRIGAGYILLMGSSGAFIAVCVAALEQGGPGLMASLIVIASLFQFALATKLSLFRRIFTPTVAGTVLMLIPVTIGPLVLGKLTDVPASASPAAAPVTAGVTLVVTLVMALHNSSAWRLWAPVIGIGAGSAVGGLVFGIYETGRISEAAWVGLPATAWPGLDLSFGPAFWALLPAFVLVTLIGALDTIGDTIAIQRVSWRRPRAVDFRSIQGALTADGLGNLLSGFAGTVPNATYTASISVAEITRVAARFVGVCVGVIFVVLAFLPKCVAAVVAIPGQVVAAYFIVLMAIFFVMGMRILFQDGLDYRKGVIVGLAFWIGSAFQLDWIFPEYFQGSWSELLRNGMTVGGFTVMFLTLFVELTGSRRQRLKTILNVDAYPKVDALLSGFAAHQGWNQEMTDR
ncbi:MAG: hypothetical protein OXG98_08495, partial [Gemmatimonadetes bacterium]|nr:hypothetical protein [Gemmatimonadota bacterium]